MLRRAATCMDAGAIIVELNGLRKVKDATLTGKNQRPRRSI